MQWAPMSLNKIECKLISFKDHRHCFVIFSLNIFWIFGTMKGSTLKVDMNVCIQILYLGKGSFDWTKLYAG